MATPRPAPHCLHPALEGSMQPVLSSMKPSPDKPDALRACVHDLRNLFAVVASAKALLDRPFNERTQAIILDALHRVAADGKVLTDGLLAGGLEDRACGADAPAELHGLASILEALEGGALKIELSIGEDTVWVLMPASEFRAVVLELVTNAARAGARTIRIRAKRSGSRFWLMIGDDGSGFSDAAWTAEASSLPGLHGTGMHRLASAVGSARGKLRIRSQAGRGSAVAVILPVIGLLPPTRSIEPRSELTGGAGILETSHG
jgi:signal transduction histidine kinase